MKFGILSVLIALVVFSFIFVVPVAAEDAAHVVPAHKDIMKLTEHGLEPQQVFLPEFDSSVFFLNTTRNALASISVEFGKKRAHCASANIRLDDNGTMRSIKAIGPKDFAIVCFPEQGEYPVTVQGLDGTAKKYLGMVVVK